MHPDVGFPKDFAGLLQASGQTDLRKTFVTSILWQHAVNRELVEDFYVVVDHYEHKILANEEDDLIHVPREGFIPVGKYLMRDKRTCKKFVTLTVLVKFKAH